MPDIYTQIASDNFTRANENPLSDAGNWTAMTGGVGQLEVLSNKVQVSQDNGLGGAIWTGSTWPSDQYADATVQAVNTGGDIRVMVRSDNSIGSNTSYFVQILGVGVAQNVKLWKDVAGAFTQLGATQTVTVTAGDVFRCSAVGTTISAFQNGAQIGTLAPVTDTVIVSGTPGLAITDSGVASLTTSSAWAGGAVNATSSAASGSGQSAVASTTFRAPLVVNVKDSSGANLPGVTVTFAAPGAGAGCTFAGGITVTTDASGNATSAITANATAGSYTVTGSVNGLPDVNFHLTNTTVFSGTVQQGEVHIDYSPTARVNNVGANQQTGDVPNSSIQEADNVRGSNVVDVPNQSSNIVVTAPQGIPQPGQFGTVHGRLDAFNVLNNPA